MEPTVWRLGSPDFKEQPLRLSTALILFFLSATASAQVVLPFAFWKAGDPSLSFTTSSQTLADSLCSGVMTVQAKSGSGGPATLTADLTVNLSATNGLTFYSDSACTNSITTVTVLTGASSANFYFVGSTAATSVVTATATNYKDATQSETITTNNFVWTGGGGNTAWSTGGNWSGGSAPAASNIAVFNGVCASNCSPTIGANISISGVRMATSYAGTITQGGGVTITLANAGWTQIAGTFAGSAAAITSTGAITLVGGTYTSTSGTLSANGDWRVGAGATFNHNSGTLLFAGAGYQSHSVSAGAARYYAVNFNGFANSYALGGQDMNVDGPLTLGSTGYSIMYSGTLLAGASVTLVDQGASVDVKLVGNASGQTVTGVFGARLHSLTIATGTNGVTFSGTVGLMQDIEIISVGTLTTTGSTFEMGHPSGYHTHSVKLGGYHLNHVYFDGYNDTYNFNSETVNIDGNLTLAAITSYMSMQTGSLKVGGNLNLQEHGAYGSTLVVLIGNAAGQTITGIAGAFVPNLELATGTNPVTLSGTVGINGSLTVTSVGTLNVAGSTLEFDSTSGTTAHSINPGTVHFNNVKLNGWVDTYDLNASTVYVDGNLTLNSIGGIGVYNGTFAVAKNITTTGNGALGSVQLQFVGSTDQTLTASGAVYFPSGNVFVNTTAGAKVILATAVSMSAAGQGLSIVAGSVDMAGFALTTKALSLNANTLTKNGGTLTVNGSVVGTGSLYGGTVNP